MSVPPFKNFDGQSYRSIKHSPLEAVAQRWAAEYRSQGKSTRVTQLGHTIPGLSGIWVVWIR